MQPSREFPLSVWSRLTRLHFARSNWRLGAPVIKVVRPEVNIWVRALAYLAGVAARLLNGRCN